MQNHGRYNIQYFWSRLAALYTHRIQHYRTYLLFTVTKEYHRLHENAVGPDFSQALDMRAEICLLRGHVTKDHVLNLKRKNRERNSVTDAAHVVRRYK